MFNIFKSKHQYKTIDAASFADQMKETGSVILDVRSPGEFRSGHIKGAINMDVQSPDFRNKLSSLNPSKTYLVYCRSGMRSTSACSQMEKSGFTNLWNLKGGIMAWRGPVKR